MEQIKNSKVKQQHKCQPPPMHKAWDDSLLLPKSDAGQIRFVHISDTHGFHRRLELPPGDVLIHSGDFSKRVGTLEEVTDFSRWLENLDYQHKIIIAGNHEWSFDLGKENILRKYPRCPSDPFSNIKKVITGNDKFIYLENSGTELYGYKIWGSPCQPVHLDQGFTLSEEKLCQVWSLIPDDTDILVTHGPPRGVLDEIGNGRGVGSTNLQNEVFGRLSQKLKVHCFGHIHEAAGHETREGIEFFNSAICDKRYKPKQVCHWFDLPNFNSNR